MTSGMTRRRLGMWVSLAGMAAMCGCASMQGEAARQSRAEFDAFAPTAGAPAVFVPCVAAPTVDGRMDEAYKAADPLHFVFLDGRTEAPTTKTTAYVVSTETELYVFVDCRTERMAEVERLAQQPADAVWQNDYVEFFLKPGREQRGRFLQIAVTAGGTVWSAARTGEMGEEDMSWSPHLTAKTQLGKEGWTAEVGIPLADLGAEAGKVSRVWVGNFGRLAQAEYEDTAWCATGQAESFVPAKFGYLWLAIGTADDAGP